MTGVASCGLDRIGLFELPGRGISVEVAGVRAPPSIARLAAVVELLTRLFENEFFEIGSSGDLKMPPSSTAKNGFAHGTVASMILTFIVTCDRRVVSIRS